MKSCISSALPQKITAGLVAILLGGCQSAPSTPIIARADHTFETTGLGTTKQNAQTIALKAAKYQCGYKTPIILSDQTTYNGVVNEKIGRATKQGTKIIGAILGTDTPELARDDDYEYFIKFRCQ